MSNTSYSCRIALRGVRHLAIGLEEQRKVNQSLQNNAIGSPVSDGGSVPPMNDGGSVQAMSKPVEPNSEVLAHSSGTKEEEEGWAVYDPRPLEEAKLAAKQATSDGERQAALRKQAEVIRGELKGWVQKTLLLPLGHYASFLEIKDGVIYWKESGKVVSPDDGVEVLGVKYTYQEIADIMNNYVLPSEMAASSERAASLAT